MAWLWNNLDLVLGLTLDHIRLSAIPILLGFAASLPLGWIATRVRWLRGILLTALNVVYTIPALALFVVLPGILGTKILDELNVLVAMTLYATAMMLRGTVDAFGSVSGDVLQSATAQGYSGALRFWTVQLPLSGPVLLANLRVVAVSTVSLLSVAALVGSGGLGRLFTAGYSRSFIDEIVVGIVFIVLLALVFDAILVLVGRLLMPWSRRRAVPTHIPFLKVVVPGRVS
jgi:osmoprotectant transport system permease protein